MKYLSVMQAALRRRLIGQSPSLHRVWHGVALFTPAIRSGRVVEHTKYASIYKKLKTAGFQETPWQFLYDGQLGGLVYPCPDIGNEIHIRFYNDRVFAELEIGRAFVSHFYGPQFNANQLVIKIINPLLNKHERALLRQAFNPSRLRMEELALPVWSPEKDTGPYQQVLSKFLAKPCGGMGRFATRMVHLPWRTLVATAGFALVLGAATSQAFGLAIAECVTAFALTRWLIPAPRSN